MEIDALARELDDIYQRMIDRIEALVETAESMDRAMRSFLQPDVYAAMPALDPVRPLTPNAAYRLMVSRLLDTVQLQMTSFRSACVEGFEDLFAWGSDATLGRTASDIRDALAEGRRHSVSAAWDRIKVRMRPDADPRAAEQEMAQGLVRAFCMRMQGRLLLPYAPEGRRIHLHQGLNTIEREIAWVVSDPQLRTMSEGCQSLATLNALVGQAELGGRVADVGGSLARHLRSKNGAYRDGDRFGGERSVEVVLRRDFALYTVGPDLFDAVVGALRQSVDADVGIIPSALQLERSHECVSNTNAAA